MRALLIAAVLVVILATAVAQSPSQERATNSSSTNSIFKTISPGVLEVGQVRVDQKRRAVSFPVILNKADGIMEYLVVTTSGKLHESIFRTEAQPLHIHTGMLLLGIKPTTNAAPPAVGEPNYQPAAQRLPGPAVNLLFEWTENGKLIRRTGEECLARSEGTNKLQTAWVYNGSGMIGSTFVAQAGGSIISLITDAGALVNNVGPGHENDDIWQANTNNLPNDETLVQLTIELPAVQKKP